MSEIQIQAIPAFSDNYIWLIKQAENAYIVDPGDAKPVFEVIEQQKLNLKGILVTHWHGDHIGGIKDLLLAFPQLSIIGPDSEKIPMIKTIVEDGEKIKLFDDVEFEVLSIPGHTLDHIAYYQKDSVSLFCGDTLFVAGCGRVFEGTFKQMLDALNKLNKLPTETQIYCAHEYTLSNLAFAQAVEPGNVKIQEKITACEKLRADNLSTVPSSLSEERETNPFLRYAKEEVINAALNQGATSDQALDVFTTLRQWKNEF